MVHKLLMKIWDSVYIWCNVEDNKKKELRSGPTFKKERERVRDREREREREGFSLKLNGFLQLMESRKIQLISENVIAFFMLKIQMFSIVPNKFKLNILFCPCLNT